MRAHQCHPRPTLSSPRRPPTAGIVTEGIDQRCLHLVTSVGVPYTGEQVRDAAVSTLPVIPRGAWPAFILFLILCLRRLDMGQQPTKVLVSMVQHRAFVLPGITIYMQMKKSKTYMFNNFLYIFFSICLFRVLLM